jgi:membrane protease subunit (stomatin/prohibitin family)
MFGSKPIELVMKDQYLIERHPNQDFKKGTKVTIQKNQELVLMLPGGLMEVIKNQFDLRLDERVKYLYFALSNKAIQQSNWGTKSRVQLEIDGIAKSLGGYGTIQFRLMNPIRYIEKRMGNATFVTAEMLTDLVLAKIPEALSQIALELKESDKREINKLTIKVKELLSQALTTVLSDMGIELVDMVVTNINLQEVEE